MAADLDAQLRGLVSALGGRAQQDAPLGTRTTYRVGGPAAVLTVVESEEDLTELARALAVTDVPVLAVGNGSNLLVADEGFPGLVVVLGESFATVDIDGTTVRAGGAALLPVVARRTAAAGLTGFEWAVGVPGSIGGAVRMNAGGHGSDMAASLVGVRVLDLRTGEDEFVSVEQLHLGFRSSAVAAHHLVLRADLALQAGDRRVAEAQIAEIVRWRREHQPGGQNAGSVFVNPAGDSAGRLIDLAGCRGLRIGSATVSDKHANFIQADEGGSAGDVFELMRVVQGRVSAATGIHLRPETRLVGFADDLSVGEQP